MWLLLKNGRVVDPASARDEVTDVLIVDGSVSVVGTVDSSGLVQGEGKAFDISGLVVVPGLIDMHVHMREPGLENKETIHTAAMAAAAGGFTTILGMPNTNPAVDNRAVVEYVLRIAETAAVNVLTTGAATKCNNGTEMAEIGDMVAAGAVAISDDAFPIQNADLLRRIMEYSRMFDVPLLTHCEDKSMTQDAVMNEGLTATIAGLRGWPRQAEEIMIWRNLLLAELADCRLHIQHVTTRGGIEAVRWAKDKGVHVTCETCPQYFSLTDEALVEFDSNAKMNPPLRTSDDVEAIKHGLADGTIDVIATDHAPHALEDKDVELQNAAFGIVGLETAVGLVMTNLVHTGALSLTDAIRRLTVGPASALGIGAGTLAEGAAGDITIIDPDAEWTVDPQIFKSKGHNTPFEGVRLKGKSVATVVWGEVVYGVGDLKVWLE